MDKYKEALNKAKKLLETSTAFDRFTIEHIFPELRDSEDKIYKRAIRQMYSFLPNKPTYIGDVRVEDIFAWLAKQGTRPRYNIGDVICDKSCTTLNKEAQPNMEIVDIRNGMYICDKGSFPVSQQDEYELVGKKVDMKPVDSVSNELREASLKYARNEMMNTTFPNNMTFEFAYNFEEGAKWQAAQKHTLSKEDEEMLNLIIARLQSHPDVDLEEYSKAYDWLNSPKVRHTWKPSDAQMIVLNEIISDGHLLGANEKILKGLYEDLKKLK